MIGMTIGEDMIGSFLIGNEHNITLLRAIDVESLLLRPRPRARTIGMIFQHLHDVRVRWLDVGGGRQYLDETEPLELGDEESRDALEAALGASAAATASFLGDLLAESKRVKGFGGKIPDFIGYLIAHDAHHRGQILALLAREKKRVPDQITHGLWEWGK